MPWHRIQGVVLVKNSHGRPWIVGGSASMRVACDSYERQLDHFQSRARSHGPSER
jgi:hypothetical protein